MAHLVLADSEYLAFAVRGHNATVVNVTITDGTAKVYGPFPVGEEELRYALTFKELVHFKPEIKNIHPNHTLRSFYRAYGRDSKHEYNILFEGFES